MRKIITLLLIICMSVSCTVTVFADDVPEHEHQWSEWEITKAATYFDEGEQIRHCIVEGCSETEIASIEKKKAYEKWVKVGVDKYYLDKESNPLTGWHKIKSSNSSKSSVKWCYFTASGKYLKSYKVTTKNTWVKMNGKTFYFTSKCKPIENGLSYYKYKYKTFVLVDISEQKLWFYKDKKLVLETDVITGTVGDGDTPVCKKGKYTETPFAVTNKLNASKKSKVKLRGSFGVRYVDRWIGFIGYEYGFHDCYTWRDEADFDNKEAYLTDGSHGCVNMKLADIKYMYKNLKVGDKVIIKK